MILVAGFRYVPFLLGYTRLRMILVTGLRTVPSLLKVVFIGVILYIVRKSYQYTSGLL